MGHTRTRKTMGAARRRRNQEAAQQEDTSEACQIHDIEALRTTHAQLIRYRGRVEDLAEKFRGLVRLASLALICVLAFDTVRDHSEGLEQGRILADVTALVAAISCGAYAHTLSSQTRTAAMISIALHIMVYYAFGSYSEWTLVIGLFFGMAWYSTEFMERLANNSEKLETEMKSL